MADGYGQAIVDPTGKKPIRLGRKFDDFDYVQTIEKMKEATHASVQKQVDKIKRNSEVVLPSITELQNSLAQLQTKALSLSNSLKLSSGVPNLFKGLESSVSKPGDPLASSYVNVAIDENFAQASTTPYAIRVTQLASADSRITANATIVDSSSVAITKADTALNLSGSFSINGVSITVETTDTLNAVINKINSANANVSAYYVTDGTNFFLKLSHTQLATPFSFEDSHNILATNFGINTQPTAKENLQAKVVLDVNGAATQPLKYDSNTITGLIRGVTLTLNNATGTSGTASDNIYINIKQNTPAVAGAITDFFKQYNEVRDFINRNTLMGENGQPLDSNAIMFGSPLMQRLSVQLDLLLNVFPINPSDTDYRSWEGVGISRQQTGIANPFDAGKYKIDQEKLNASLNTNFARVKKLFGEDYSSSNTMFRVWDFGKSQLNLIANQPITLTYRTDVEGNYTAQLKCTDLQGNQQQTDFFSIANPARIIGPTGTVFEGLTIGHSASLTPDSSITTTLNINSGLATNIAQTLGRIVDEKTGEFQIELNRIKNQNKSSQSKIDNAENRAQALEKRWMAKASQLNVARAHFDGITSIFNKMYDAMRAS